MFFDTVFFGQEFYLFLAALTSSLRQVSQRIYIEALIGKRDLM